MHRASRFPPVNPDREAADVRGAVTGDYQNYLEEQWVTELKKLYPAKINRKVLKKARYPRSHLLLT